MDSLLPIIIKYFHSRADRTQKVVKLKSPQELYSIFADADVDLSLQKAESVDIESLKKAVELILDFSVKTSHPMFFNQLFAGTDEVAVVGDILTTILNTSGYTYEVAPVVTLIENSVIEKMGTLAGFGDNTGGILCPGGSIANMIALQVARYNAFPEMRATGVRNLPPMVAFTSKHSHYSLGKSAVMLGLGTDHMVKVAVDPQGRMIPAELRKAVVEWKEKGFCPVFVNATAGTTVVGAFDPFDEIADIAEEFGMWFHVDGAWGGSILFSQTHKGVMKGSERADSMTWDPHKFMGIPQQCSAFITRHKGILHDCNQCNAQYLFQSDKLYTELDMGDSTFYCGRHVDCIKLWLAWKATGDSGYEARVDHAIELAQYVVSQVKARDNFSLAYEPSPLTNVCFWYGPPEANLAPQIKAQMQETGSAMVGYQPLDDKPNFFRLVLMNPEVTKEDMDRLLDNIESIGFGNLN
jgi:glutamate decarboxylase